MTTQELTTCQIERGRIRTSDEALMWAERWADPLMQDAAEVHLLREQQGVDDEFCPKCGSEVFDGKCGECEVPS
jgi:hypothetical protein